MLKESLGSHSSCAWKNGRKKAFKQQIAIVLVWEHLVWVFFPVFGQCSSPSLKKYPQKKTPFHSCLCYTNCGIMFSISAVVLYIIRITSSVIIHCCVTFYSLLCSYSYKHNYIAQSYKLHILEDVSIFLLVFIKLCLYTFLLIYIASFLLNITAKYN